MRTFNIKSVLNLDLKSATLAALCSSALLSQAGILVTFPLNNNADGNNGLNPGVVDTGVLAAVSVSKPIGSGLGAFGVGSDAGLGQVLITGPGTAVTGANSATALSNNWFFEIALTPVASMDIGSIDLSWSRGGTAGDRGWFVRSSQDTFSSDLFSVTSPAGSAVGFNATAFAISNHVGLTSPTVFRFYSYTGSTGRYIDFQNVQFNAAVAAVPEPTSLPLFVSTLGLLSVGLLGRRRAKKSH